MPHISIYVVYSGYEISVGLGSFCRYELLYGYINRFLPVMLGYRNMKEIWFLDTYPDDNVFHLGEISIDPIHTL